MTNFENLIKERRSATTFIEGVEITERELGEIFNLVKFAPSCFNLQHAQFLVVNDPELKDQVQQAAYGQYKVHTASAAIVVLGDKEAFTHAERIYEGMLALKVFTPEEYEQTIGTIQGMYAGREDFQRDEAIRNASLAAMLFMLAAKDRGWDTCPMIGFDPAALSSLLRIPDHLEPVLLITIGREDTSKRRMRGYRKPVGEFVRYNRFE